MACIFTYHDLYLWFVIIFDKSIALLKKGVHFKFNTLALVNTGCPGYCKIIKGYNDNQAATHQIVKLKIHSNTPFLTVCPHNQLWCFPYGAPDPKLHCTKLCT